MLKYIEEAEKFLIITGYRDLIIDNSEEFLIAMRQKLTDVEIQFFDAELVASWQHLYFAVLNALLAFEQEVNLSKSVAMETLLYASAQRQIKKAITLMGLKNSTTNVAVVIIGESLESVHDVLEVISKRVGKKTEDAVLEISRNKMVKICDLFGINAIEFEAVSRRARSVDSLVDLVIERTALLATNL